MRETITKRKPLLFTSLGTVAVVLLLSGSLIVPTLSAYAVHDNGKGKSEDNKKYHQKDRKGKDHEDGKGIDHKGHERCNDFASEKYDKHCD
jgi:hypothetical protein